MICKKCGAQLKDHAKFCSKCGTPAVNQSPSAKKSNKNLILVIMLIVLVAVLLAACVFVFILLKDSNFFNKKDTSTTRYISETDKEEQADMVQDADGSEPDTAQKDSSDSAENMTGEKQAEKAAPSREKIEHYYEVFVGDVTWYEAQKKCEELGGHLCTVTSQDEYQKVLNYIAGIKNEVEKNKLQLWLGGFYNGTDYTWITGEDFTFSDWIQDEPSLVDKNNGNKEEYICYSYNQKYNTWGWNDVPADISQWWSGNIAYLCEWDVNVNDNTWSDSVDAFPLDMYFSSGVGGWSTEITIQKDGSFEGEHHDSDMGVTGAGYPDGTMYICEFNGQFETVGRVDEATYLLKLKRLDEKAYSDDEWIENDIKYIHSYPYGLENCTYFLFYLPEKRLDTLSEDYMFWWKSTIGYSADDSVKTLGSYSLHNVKKDEAFFN